MPKTTSEDVKEVTKEVKHFGDNGAHIVLPKKWVGQKVNVSLIENAEKKEETEAVPTSATAAAAIETPIAA